MNHNTMFKYFLLVAVSVCIAGCYNSKKSNASDEEGIAETTMTKATPNLKVLTGATIEMILEESKKLNIDLIIAGHTKHGFFYNAFVGSVSSEIIKKSKIPVLIVPL